MNDKIKVGDKAVIADRTGVLSSCYVERLTKTRIYVSGGEWFRRSDGSSPRGDGWSLRHLAPWSEALGLELRGRAARRQVALWSRKIASAVDGMPPQQAIDLAEMLKDFVKEGD